VARFLTTLVKLEAPGVCHPDLPAAHGDWTVKPRPPFIPGREGCGSVVALGDGVKDLKIGHKVGHIDGCVVIDYRTP
jgi:propanol-preferring alcohol dehydrogenase